MLHRVSVPPIRVRPGRHEANHCRALVHGGTVGFCHPLANRLAVGWIHENDFTAPGLEQSVLSEGKVSFALGVLIG